MHAARARISSGPGLASAACVLLTIARRHVADVSARDFPRRLRRNALVVAFTSMLDAPFFYSVGCGFSLPYPTVILGTFFRP